MLKFQKHALGFRLFILALLVGGLALLSSGLARPLLIRPKAAKLSSFPARQELNAAAASQSLQRQDAGQRHGSAEDHVPVVDLNRPEPGGSKRQLKGKRFQTGVPLSSRADTARDSLAIIHTKSVGPQPALPAASSGLIVIGEVTRVAAHLTPDKDDLYSEFTIRIQEVLKGSNAHQAGSLIVADREGGALRFPSGAVFQLRVKHEGLPGAGRRYVFFLRQNPETQDYNILTAYELRGQKVFPLDSSTIPKIGSSQPTPSDVFADADVQTFLSTVTNAIAQSATPPERDGNRD